MTKIYVNLHTGETCTEKELRLELALHGLHDEEECKNCRYYLGKAPCEQVTMDDMLKYLEDFTMDEELEWESAWVDM